MRRLRMWDLVHRWTSLICTLFIVMLGITGLPLIFHDEINDLSGKRWHSPPFADGMSAPDLDRVMAGARARFPGRAALFASHEPYDDDPLWFVTFAGSTADSRLVQAAVDARTGQVIAEPAVGDTGLMGFLLKLHVEMFAGLPGELFLGFMGVMLMVSIVSGVVLYPSFMRNLSFGEIRRRRTPRVRWLDFHNFAGIVTLAWLIVVAATGVVNSYATLILNYWQSHAVSSVAQSFAGRPPFIQRGQATPSGQPETSERLQQAVAAARGRYPDLAVQFVAFPGSSFSTPYHYGIYLRGKGEFESRQLRPVFVDALDAHVSAAPQLPWYVVALLMSEPLHFGDYGGLPLKLLWAVLDALSLFVLGTGLYLYVVRPRRQHDPHLHKSALAQDSSAAQNAPS